MFSGTKLQVCTYLFGVCLFSIAFLVFLNSSISFVVTDLLGLDHGIGDAIGTLGFADELLALLACPVWGLLSDRIGIRYVCVAGYAIIALSLALFVQATNVYPQLLLGRLLFSLGASAVTTMVTAALPCVASNQPAKQDSSSDETRQESRTASTSTNANQVENDDDDDAADGDEETLVVNPDPSPQSSSTTFGYRQRGGASKLAGLVGTFTGCGAVFALVFLLPLPTRFEKSGVSAPDAVKRSFYIVAVVALAVSVFCFIGLRKLGGEKPGNWKAAFRRFGQTQTDDSVEADRDLGYCPASYWSQFKISVSLGFTCPNIGLAYIGGFVARASSVGISLFIPMYVNQYYRHAGLCGNEDTDVDATGLGTIKQSCPKAYIAASILTGVSQLVALCTAPVLGYLSSRSHRYNAPLLFACLSGTIGYPLFVLLPSPKVEGNVLAFIAMILIGISQIGAIVCSLGLLGDEVMRQESLKDDMATVAAPNDDEAISPISEPTEEQAGLLTGYSRSNDDSSSNDLTRYKGSIAGVYSLSGGAGILVLTKIGGLMSDKVHPASPFYILAGFNGFLLLSGLVISLSRMLRE